MAVSIEDAEKIVDRPRITENLGGRRVDFGPVGDETQGLRLGFGIVSQQAVTTEGVRVLKWVKQPALVIWRQDGVRPLAHRQDLQALKEPFREKVAERLAELRSKGII